MRILLVEDDPSLGEGMRVALHREGYTVDWLRNGGDALAALDSDAFSALILDLGLPDMDGLEVLARLRRRHTLPVVVLTARDALVDRLRGLDGGADDYVLKPFDLAELLARLRVVTRRGEGRRSAQLQLGALVIDEARHAVTWQGQEVSLGRREFALLLELARHAGQVIPRSRLESLLYGWDEDVESNALEVHVHHLRKKLDRSLIVTLRGIGYRLEVPA
ncbi:response regulator [Franzmannia qiaohouensis]|uniref:Response regulator n=1 Tax=Franzmannia qiaohouensis TaxID=1329370 RepID=A0ABU1HGP6_9GAMM|nr:response regulator [Halomonas qiaohouensis]MDR5906643.1 response regulator [Halomonas qiaohouensis]